MERQLIYRILTITLTLVALTACSESDEIAGYNYADNSSIRIQPVVKSGIEYDIRTTRGSGPIEQWSTDSMKWKNAKFYTYALETRNSLGGQANYQTVSDVMDHQLTRILNANGALRFYDSNGVAEEKYYSRWRAHRYKFFTYFTDDAVLGPIQRGKTKITQSVSIDGHQDLIHGFAYHTDSELALLVGRMPNNDETKLFTDANGGREYLYSGMAGNRGIHPQFHLKHLLSQFNVEVQGVLMSDKEKRYSFLQVLIDSISIYAPSQGTLTIANDTWNDEQTYTQSFQNREILKWGEETKAYGLDIVPYPMSNSNYLPHVDFEGMRQQIESMGILNTRAYYQVHSLESQKICDPIMLPSVDSTLVLTLGYRHIYYDQDETGKWTVNQEKTQDSQWRQPFRLTLPKELRPYKPGGIYTICIKIYGPEQISIDVLNGEHWQPGGNVDIDTDTGGRTIEIK